MSPLTAQEPLQRSQASAIAPGRGPCANPQSTTASAASTKFAGGPTPSNRVKSPCSVVAGVAAAARIGGAAALRTSFEPQNSVLAPTANQTIIVNRRAIVRRLSWSDASLTNLYRTNDLDIRMNLHKEGQKAATKLAA